MTGRLAGSTIPPSQRYYLTRLSERGPIWYGIGNSSLIALERRGLITKLIQSNLSARYAITDAGRAARITQDDGE